MLQRFKGSLTLRIYLLTSVLLIAVCAITYGMIAYLTPISYTAILEGELSQQVESLVGEMEKVRSDSCEVLLTNFVRQTGASIRVVDNWGNVLYDTVPMENVGVGMISETEIVQYDSNEGNVAVSAEGFTIASSSSDETSIIMEDASSAALSENNSTAIMEGMTATESGSAHYFTFVDGTDAILIAQGGMRAINQATEALGRILPYLAITILLTSLGGSFFLARFITRPIVSMSGIAQRMSNLDFVARWNKQRSDEIGVLGESLNLLSDNLSQALGSLSEANKQLQSDIEQEREIERQRMAFFSAASHELKTPITILKGQLSGMLAQVGIYQDREKYLARALTVTGRMESLVKEILTINRIEAIGYSLKVEPVDLSALMEKQLTQDAELIEQKELTIETEIEAGVIVQGDGTLLSNVLDNVLMNAILYSPAKAFVYIRVSENMFSIENTGTSVPEESLAELFTPFYRVEQSRNRKSGGSGLGLYLTKSILDLHGASCEIRNTLRGVVFCAEFLRV